MMRAFARLSCGRRSAAISASRCSVGTCILCFVAVRDFICVCGPSLSAESAADCVPSGLERKPTGTARALLPAPPTSSVIVLVPSPIEWASSPLLAFSSTRHLASSRKSTSTPTHTSSPGFVSAASSPSPKSHRTSLPLLSLLTLRAAASMLGLSPGLSSVASPVGPIRRWCFCARWSCVGVAGVKATWAPAIRGQCVRIRAPGPFLSFSLARSERTVARRARARVRVKTCASCGKTQEGKKRFGRLLVFQYHQRGFFRVQHSSLSSLDGPPNAKRDRHRHRHG